MSISNQYCSRFGQTAVEMGFISAGQLQDALEITEIDAALGGGQRSLPTILFIMDGMSNSQIEAIFNRMFKETKTDNKIEAL